MHFFKGRLSNTMQVVQNFAANVGLAIGASPIMANYAEEAADLAKLGGALVINMGTVTPEGLKSYCQALKAYNDADRPVVFDPVGYAIHPQFRHTPFIHSIALVLSLHHTKC